MPAHKRLALAPRAPAAPDIVEHAPGLPSARESGRRSPRESARVDGRRGPAAAPPTSVRTRGGTPAHPPPGRLPASYEAFDGEQLAVRLEHMRAVVPVFAGELVRARRQAASLREANFMLLELVRLMQLQSVTHERGGRGVDGRSRAEAV